MEMKKLYNENFKITKKEIEEDSRRWKKAFIAMDWKTMKIRPKNHGK